MVVSVPEKTLEHWASLYLTYRYRSHASLWWPAHGEDINFGYLPTRPGKAVQLELKTTYLNAAGHVHTVKVDLAQLDRYLKRPHCSRPFYVFPMPHWGDTLESASAAAGIPVTEAGFSRSNAFSRKSWWFAHWMVALTTDHVAQIVSTNLAGFRASGTPSESKLVTFDFRSGYRATKWLDGRAHPTIPWQTLWTSLDVCGKPTWPQVVRLPWSLMGKQVSVRHRDLQSLLAEAANADDDELVSLGSSENGIFEPLDLPPSQGVQEEQLEPVEGEPDRRIVVFLGAEGLRRQ